MRGVNSYTTGSGDFVEAYLRFDNVYQNTQNPNLYARVEGNFDMGNEWTILKTIKKRNSQRYFISMIGHQHFSIVAY